MGFARQGPISDARRPAAMALAAAELCVVALLALGIVRLGFALAVRPGPVGDWQAPSPPVATDPAQVARFDPFFRTSDAGEAVRVSDLQLALMGTRLDQATGRGSAIIALDGTRQESFAVGDEVLPGVRLVAVAFDTVTIDNGGSREQLFLDQSAPAPAAGPQAPATAARLGADLMAVPRLNGTRITGLQLSPKGSGTAFAAAGLKPGDVLVRVDGQEVAALGDPAALVRRLDAGGTMLEIERGGQVMRLQLGAGGRT